MWSVHVRYGRRVVLPGGAIRALREHVSSKLRSTLLIRAPKPRKLLNLCWTLLSVSILRRVTCIFFAYIIVYCPQSSHSLYYIILECPLSWGCPLH